MRRRRRARCGWLASARARADARPPPPPARSMDADLACANEALVKVRRERLRVLYEQERREWQTELASMGLTMEAAS